MLKEGYWTTCQTDYNTTYTIEFLCAGTDAATRFALATGD